MEINGKKQYYCDKGRGQPAIVFLTGIGPGMEDFSGLQKQLSKKFRTLAYDRSGYGRSEENRAERNLENTVSELKALLAKLLQNESFILVAHSRGASVARFFAHERPGSLKGMVLVDPALPELMSRKRKIRTETERRELDAYYANFCTDTVKYSQVIRNEFYHCFNSDSVFLSNKPFAGNIPVTILASVKNTWTAYSAKEIEIKTDILKSYLQKAPHLKLILTEKSGHFIHHDEPQLVVQEIELMTKRVN